MCRFWILVVSPKLVAVSHLETNLPSPPRSFRLQSPPQLSSFFFYAAVNDNGFSLHLCPRITFNGPLPLYSFLTCIQLRLGSFSRVEAVTVFTYSWHIDVFRSQETYCWSILQRECSDGNGALNRSVAKAVRRMYWLKSVAGSRLLCNFKQSLKSIKVVTPFNSFVFWKKKKTVWRQTLILSFWDSIFCRRPQELSISLCMKKKYKRKKPDEAWWSTKITAGLHTHPELPCLHGSNLFQLDMAAECVASASYTHFSRCTARKQSDGMHSDLTHTHTHIDEHRYEKPDITRVKTRAHSCTLGPATDTNPDSPPHTPAVYYCQE